MNADYERAERVQQNLDNFRQQMLLRWRGTLQGRAYPCRNPQYFSIYKVRIENIRKRGQP
jgi:hypothetical protein